VSRVTFIYAAHIGHSTLANHGWRPDPQGAWGATVDVCHVEGGRSRISLSTPPWGLTIDVCRVDGRCSRISVQHLLGGPVIDAF
jgi:hypothetical protein